VYEFLFTSSGNLSGLGFVLSLAASIDLAQLWVYASAYVSIRQNARICSSVARSFNRPSLQLCVASPSVSVPI
jgi:hypothetical protein